MAYDANSTPVPVAHRAGFPLPIIETDARRRLEAAVERLGFYHDRYARHARRATEAMERIERLRQAAIGALDVIDGDADVEPGGDEEPSLGFTEARVCDDQDALIQLSPIGGVEWLDLEDACEDDGNDSDSEYSFCGVTMVGACVDESAEACSPETGEGPQ